jgi:hypothetical protein
MMPIDKTVAATDNDIVNDEDKRYSFLRIYLTI